jgi:hypothetical protein
MSAYAYAEYYTCRAIAESFVLARFNFLFVVAEFDVERWALNVCCCVGQIQVPTFEGGVRRMRVRGRLARSKDAFLDVVDIEEELHFAGGLAELRDVFDEILLHGIREIAQTDSNHLVIPPDD